MSEQHDATVERIVALLRHAGADHAIAVMWAQRQQPWMERRLLADAEQQETEARELIATLVGSHGNPASTQSSGSAQSAAPK